MKIDFHCHAFPAECFQMLKKYYPDVVELKEDDQGRLYALWANTRLPGTTASGWWILTRQG